MKKGFLKEKRRKELMLGILEGQDLAMSMLVWKGMVRPQEKEEVCDNV